MPTKSNLVIDYKYLDMFDMGASESTYYFEGFVISRFYICPGALIKNELVHQDFVQIHSSANDLLSIVNRGCVVLKRV